jgi:hypothetical protein
VSDESLKLVNGAILHSGFPEFLPDNSTLVFQKIAEKMENENQIEYKNFESIIEKLSQISTSDILRSYAEGNSEK